MVRTSTAIILALLAAHAGSQALAAIDRPDFNGDGRPDLAIGAPGEDRGAANAAGGVIVMYGFSGGFADDDAEVWDQNTAGLPERCESGDRFAQALTWGDFDGDGFDDLVVGVPGESIGVIARAGCVHVIYGRTNQMNTQRNQLWHQNRPGVLDKCEQGDEFGAALAAGDFDGDGFDDLAIGIPGERVGGQSQAGAIHVLYGSANGLRSAGNAFIHQNSPGVGGAAAQNDRFGAALCVGFFNDDEFADLAISAPEDNINGLPSAGAVTVLYGSAAGLQTAGSDYWHQGTLGSGGLEPFDRFGAALASGDFNGDGIDDLAVGVDRESLGAIRYTGAVNIIYGAAGGLTTNVAQLLTGANTIDWTARRGDGFGAALAAGDLDGDGFDDLAIGVPFRRPGPGLSRAGVVIVVNGSALGVNPDAARQWTQSSLTLLEESEAGDLFGFALTIMDVNGDGFDDLIIGSPGETGNAGLIVLAFGSELGVEENAGLTWNQGSVGAQVEAGDQFGAAFAR